MGTAAQHDFEAPTGLEAENVEAGVLLCWETPEVGAGGVTGFCILTRRPEFGEAFYTLVDDTGTSYADPSADEVDTLYAYQIQTLRGGVASASSATAVVTPTAARIGLCWARFRQRIPRTRG